MTANIRTCCIPGCKSLGYKDGEKLCSFPALAERKQIWIDNIRLSGGVCEDWVPPTNSFVCQIHFEKSCFVQDSENAPLKMARGAVPTIFPDTPSKAVGKPTVSIIRTRRAAGITPKPKTVFEVDASPSTRLKKETPLPGHTFKPVIAKAAGETAETSSAPAPIVPKTTSVVVISSDLPKQPAPKRSFSASHGSKKSNVSSCGNCVQMQEKLNQKVSFIRELEMRISDLKQELNQQDSTRTAAVSKIDRLKESLKDIYTEHQLVRLCDGTTRGRPWDLETVRRAAKLVLACGRNGYQEILNQGQPFPSLKTLNRLLYKRRYLSSTLDNPDPVISNELEEDMSDSDHEDESEGSAEEIEENIVTGEEGRILKKSRKTRKTRNSLQKCQEAYQEIQDSQAVTSLDSEAAILEGVESMAADNQILLQQIDQLGEVVDQSQGTDGTVVTPAIVSQYGSITIIQDPSMASPQLSTEIIDDILKAQNILHEEVKEIRVEGSYITILKHQDLIEDNGLLPQGIIG